jgi:hypothetical protein
MQCLALGIRGNLCAFRTADNYLVHKGSRRESPELVEGLRKVSSFSRVPAVRKFSPGAPLRFAEAAIWTGFDSDSLLMLSRSLLVVDSTAPSSSARKPWWRNNMIPRGVTSRRVAMQETRRTVMGLNWIWALWRWVEELYGGG